MHDVCQTQFTTKEMKVIHELIELVIKRLGASLGKKKLQELQGKVGIKTKTGKALEHASSMAGIGSYILSMVSG